MARYKADSCYVYTGEQSSRLNAAKSKAMEKYHAMDFINTTRKTNFLDVKIEDIGTSLSALARSLDSSSYTPT